TRIAMQGNNVVPTGLAKRIDNPHLQRLTIPFRFSRRAAGRGTRLLLRVGFGLLEKLHRLANTNAPAPITSMTLLTKYSYYSSVIAGNIGKERNSSAKLSATGNAPSV